jgi:nitrogen fixation protein FixH
MCFPRLEGTCDEGSPGQFVWTATGKGAWILRVEADRGDQLQAR